MEYTRPHGERSFGAGEEAGVVWVEPQTPLGVEPKSRSRLGMRKSRSTS